MKKSKWTLVVLIMVALIWGGGYTATQIAIDANWSTYSILMVRSFAGALICLPFCLKTKFWKNKEILRVGTLCGILFFAGYVLQLEGQRFTTIANTAFLTSAGIILVPVFSFLILKKMPSKEEWIACIMGMVGAGFLSLKGGFTLHIGDLLVLLGAVSYALHIICVDKNNKVMSAWTLATIQFIVMGILATLGVIFTKSPVFGGVEGWWGIAYFTIFSGVIGFVGQIWSQKRMSPGKVSLVLSLESIFATIIAVLFMNQKLDWQTIVGGSLMFLGVFIMQLDFNKLFKKKKISNKMFEKELNKDIINNAIEEGDSNE